MKLMMRGTTLAFVALVLAAGCSGRAVSDEAGSDEEPRLEEPSTDDDDSGEITEPDAGASTDQELTDNAPGPGDDGCVSDREFLATRAWPEVLGTICLSCHGPGGIAANQNAAFTLQPAAYPGFLDVNLENISSNARIESDGVSVVLQKPLGQLNHGGGAILTQGSPAYETLQELVQRLRAPEQCPEQAHVATFDDLESLNPEGTFRKAALTLSGRLPTGTEVETLRSEGESALLPAIRTLFTEESFYDRLVEIFNDQWLTDRYLDNSQGLLRDEDFPNTDTYYDGLDDSQRVEARTSVAREPLALMAYIVRNDRPFTEIVTADYTVLNPYTAVIYNNEEMNFENSYDAGEFREGRIFAVKDGVKVPFPHAGILTSPMFLNRYPTSPTNRNRHRARIVLRELLATDILRVADRPIDPTAAESFANPTREEPSCSMCHVTLDPIAGAFQKFDDNDYERYLPNRSWHEEMYAPGFGGEKMTLADFDAAPQWLAQRIATDPRFPQSVVRNLYKSLVGELPIEFPEDPSDGNYAAWHAQDSTLRAITQAFIESNYNLKVAIEQIVLSPYFRASNTHATTETRLAQLRAVGTGRLLTPELLDKKIVQVFGQSWMNGRQALLTSGLRILYGGIDSNGVTARLTVPNGMMSAIMWRASTELACHNAAADFSREMNNRRLFREVQLDTVPEDEIGEPIETNVEMIRQNLRYLYFRLLGENLVTGSAEEARVMDLFVRTWREGRAKLASQEIGRDLPGECQYRRAPGADADLPQDQQLRRDDNYVIRSWMAVLTYLLSDYRFLYD